MLLDECHRVQQLRSMACCRVVRTVRGLFVSFRRPLQFVYSGLFITSVAAPARKDKRRPPRGRRLRFGRILVWTSVGALLLLRRSSRHAKAEDQTTAHMNHPGRSNRRRAALDETVLRRDAPVSQLHDAE